MKTYRSLWSFACLATIVLAIGCGGEKKEETKKANKGDQVNASDAGPEDHGDPGHSHGDAPHGGTIADWGGGKYHVEFMVNHEKKEATVYILGGDAKTIKPVDAKELTLTIKEPSLTTTLKAVPEDSDPEGQCSKFVGSHDAFGEERAYEGSITGKVGDTPYSGDFKEDAH